MHNAKGISTTGVSAQSPTTSFSVSDYGLTKSLYDVSETLQKLSIGRTSLYALVNEGELTPVKFGKKTLFAAPELAALMNRRRKTHSSLEAA